ncbi:hypothetical protein [Pelagibacterium lentulum]|uniref:Rap1a immunity protein domain-containing protein n=1 Tax=Pelagibacterium lentulum TaxID=2029865 RepID=A0A916R7N3_9HYPH|nr:hypothetical protein [Pelagibacterium lentulum]GGA36279.1 hypothetical protein GCM10011499_02030 [Pelagibacterium lentulum]
MFRAMRIFVYTLPALFLMSPANGQVAAPPSIPELTNLCTTFSATDEDCFVTVGAFINFARSEDDIANAVTSLASVELNELSLCVRVAEAVRQLGDSITDTQQSLAIEEIALAIMQCSPFPVAAIPTVTPAFASDN